MCAGCDKKTWEAGKKLIDESINPPTDTPPVRLAMNCIGCGMKRLLPAGLKVNDTFELVPCPKCFNGFKGQLLEDRIEELL